ncbi:hypothetical protein LZ554_009445 [Drepanopeziza brunnea f. sp. 'monogermtubi']|nr:hypothetical protein LZ554_009445 [Drepanopeziza brunnea f. sp. 'monogermtubi']
MSSSIPLLRPPLFLPSFSSDLLTTLSQQPPHTVDGTLDQEIEEHINHHTRPEYRIPKQIDTHDDRRNGTSSQRRGSILGIPEQQHLFSYPVISDSISTFKSNPYGAKSLSLSSSLTHTFADPLMPYLSKPYQYVSPYVKRADSIGDSTLSTLDSKFPVVKKPTGELVEDGKKMVFFPLMKGNEGKEYVFGVYGSEVKKVGGDGIVTWGKAAIATGLVVGGDAVGWLQGFLAGKKAEAKEVSNEKLNH